MIDNDTLNDRVVSFSFGENKLQLIASRAESSFDFIPLKVDTILTDIDLDVLLMSSILMSCFFNNVKVLSNNLRPNLDIEHSLSSLSEVHLH
jgi:hypothetical protein